MTLSRRQFIELSASACLATTALAACASKPKSTEGASARGSSSEGAATTVVGSPIGFDVFLEQRGYTAAPAASLITGHAFNGGLRYDDDAGIHTEKTYVKQQVARVGDVAKKSTPGTLPFFTLIGIDTSTPALANASADLILAYLLGVVGLDPSRMRVTTTQKSSAFLPLLAKYGITDAQVRLRSWDDAVKDGAGSGYFAPAGHPAKPSAPSFSIEYVMPDGVELEIAEICHSEGNGRSSGGIGVERVEMARTGQIPSWDSQLEALARAVQAESKRTGAAVPPGAAAITGPRVVSTVSG
ncbi:MAG: hypothetical protein ACKPEA_05305 [Planctomycetota bacterium]